MNQGIGLLRLLVYVSAVLISLVITNLIILETHLDGGYLNKYSRTAAAGHHHPTTLKTLVTIPAIMKTPRYVSFPMHHAHSITPTILFCVKTRVKKCRVASVARSHRSAKSAMLDTAQVVPGLDSRGRATASQGRFQARSGDVGRYSCR